MGYIGANGPGTSTTIKKLPRILVPTSARTCGREPVHERRQFAREIGVVRACVRRRGPSRGRGRRAPCGSLRIVRCAHAWRSVEVAVRARHSPDRDRKAVAGGVRPRFDARGTTGGAAGPTTWGKWAMRALGTRGRLRPPAGSAGEALISRRAGCAACKTAPGRRHPPPSGRRSQPIANGKRRSELVRTSWHILPMEVPPWRRET